MGERGWGWTASKIRQTRFLEWLTPQSSSATFAPVKPFYDAQPDAGVLTIRVVHDELRELEQQSLIYLAAGLGGIEDFAALVTAQGRQLAEENQAQRADKRLRRTACRDAMVDWLSSQDASSPLRQPARDQMLAEPRYGTWLAEPFSEADLDAAAAWLQRQHLVDGMTVDQCEGPVRLYLTDEGAACAEEYCSDTTRYVAARGPAGPKSATSRGTLDARSVAPSAEQDGLVAQGHAFLSYVREDSEQVDRLQQALQDAGIPVWRDTADLWPGEDWKEKIREAITDNALVFVLCFSRNGLSKATSYQNEEILLAVEQLRRRQPARPWLIPVRLDECEIPDRDLGGGRRLSSLQRVDLFGDASEDGVARLVTAIRRILQPAGVSQSGAEPRRVEPQARSDADSPRMAQAFIPATSPGHDHSRTGNAFTRSWRYTSDGFEATPLMNMASTAMPGRMTDQSPFVRIGICVACAPVPRDTGSSVIGSELVRFLSGDPVTELISSLIHPSGDVPWVRLAGQGVIRLEAALGYTGNGANPPASAMLLPPVAGMQTYRQSDGMACLWLHIEPRGPDGSTARPASLPIWHQRLQHAISVAPAFVQFLDDKLGLQPGDEPAARVGVLLNAANSMTELIDPGSLRTLPDATPSRQFLGYVIADRAGERAGDVARTTLAQLCDNTLHLADFGPVLAPL